MPDLIPIQHRIGGVAQPLHGHRQSVEILQVPPYGLANHLGPAALECRSRRIQGGNLFVRQAHSDLG